MTDTELVERYQAGASLTALGGNGGTQRRAIAARLQALGVTLRVRPVRKPANTSHAMKTLAKAMKQVPTHWTASELPELCQPCSHVCRPGQNHGNRCGLRLRIDLVWSDDDTCPAWDPPGGRK